MMIQEEIFENPINAFAKHGVDLSSGFGYYYIVGTYKPVQGFVDNFSISKGWKLKGNGLTKPRPFKALINELFNLLEEKDVPEKQTKGISAVSSNMEFHFHLQGDDQLLWLSKNIKETKRGLKWLPLIQDILWRHWGWKKPLDKPKARAKRKSFAKDRKPGWVGEARERLGILGVEPPPPVNRPEPNYFVLQEWVEENDEDHEED